MKKSIKPDYWVLSLSGGKDSTALGLEWLKRHQQDPFTYPLHEVFYCDTGMDFPAMAEHINRLEKLFKSAGVKFTRLKSKESFEYFMFEFQTKKTSDSQQQKGLAWPTLKVRWCTDKLKRSVITSYFKELKKEKNVIQLIGLAADEQERIQKRENQKNGRCYPLVEWGWTEADCLKYCYDHGFDWGGLYEIFHRVSCWCCPFKSLEELRKLRKYYPDLWVRLLDMEHRSWNSFKDRYSIDQLEVRFAFEEERLDAGLPINKTREFMSSLKNRLEEAGVPQITDKLIDKK